MLFTCDGTCIGEIAKKHEFGPELHVWVGSDPRPYALRWSADRGCYVGVYSGTLYTIRES